MRKVKKVLAFLWPPADRYFYRLRDESPQEGLNTEEIKSIDVPLLEKWIDELAESEKDRLNRLEGKAQSFLFIFTVATGLATALPTTIALLAQSLPVEVVGGALFISTISVIYLMGAVWYAVKARKAKRLYVLTHSDMSAEIRNGSISHRSFLKRKSQNILNNQRRLLDTSNDLGFAEQMFIRAVILVASSGVAIAWVLFSFGIQPNQTINIHSDKPNYEHEYIHDANSVSGENTEGAGAEVLPSSTNSQQNSDSTSSPLIDGSD
ncbi:MAG: hypothetical protein RhofKO_08750 [Rhodothermales bacterium]